MDGASFGFGLDSVELGAPLVGGIKLLIIIRWFGGMVAPVCSFAQEKATSSESSLPGAQH